MTSLMRITAARRFFGIPAIGALFVVGVVPMHAAMLKQETVKAWDEYIQVVEARVRSANNSGDCFLWMDESRDRISKVRAGEIAVAPFGAASSIDVPSGIIHHWVGAVFIPNTTLDQVSSAMREYGRYKDIYHPAVTDSRSIFSSDTEDRFSLVLANKSLFRRTALDSEYRSSQFRLDDRRQYTITRATRIQEITGYGTPDQHPLPENEGMGLIWRLYGITRLQERHGGVYVEVEAIVLSRDIPASIRWFVDPIVRRVAKSSFITSLQQTRDAVRSNSKLVSQTVR
jgi:hypothetical protein